MGLRNIRERDRAFFGSFFPVIPPEEWDDQAPRAGIVRKEFSGIDPRCKARDNAVFANSSMYRYSRFDRYSMPLRLLKMPKLLPFTRSRYVAAAAVTGPAGAAAEKNMKRAIAILKIFLFMGHLT